MSKKDKKLPKLPKTEKISTEPMAAPETVSTVVIEDTRVESVPQEKTSLPKAESNIQTRITDITQLILERGDKLHVKAKKWNKEKRIEKFVVIAGLHMTLEALRDQNLNGKKENFSIPTTDLEILCSSLMKEARLKRITAEMWNIISIETYNQGEVGISFEYHSLPVSYEKWRKRYPDTINFTYFPG